MHIPGILSLLKAEKELDGLRDESGRPLGEAACPKELREDVPIKFVICPYADSRLRHEKPMNQSALPGITNNWAKVLGCTFALRKHYIDSLEKDHLGIKDLWRISEALANVPLYLRLKDPSDRRPIPNYLAALYKTIIGAVGVFRLTTLRSMANRIHPDSIIESATLYEFMQENKSLIGKWEVCAGPPNLIKEFLELLCEGTLSSEADAGCLPSIIPDLDDLLHFASMRQYIGALEDIMSFRSSLVLQRWQTAVRRHSQDISPETRSELEKGLAEFGVEKVGNLNVMERRRRLQALISPNLLWKSSASKSSGRAYLLTVLQLSRGRAKSDFRSSLLQFSAQNLNPALGAHAAGCLDEWLNVEKALFKTVAWCHRRFCSHPKPDLDHRALVVALTNNDPRTFFENIITGENRSPHHATVNVRAAFVIDSAFQKKVEPSSSAINETEGIIWPPQKRKRTRRNPSAQSSASKI